MQMKLPETISYPLGHCDSKRQAITSVGNSVEKVVGMSIKDSHTDVHGSLIYTDQKETTHNTH